MTGFSTLSDADYACRILEAMRTLNRGHILLDRCVIGLGNRHISHFDRRDGTFPGFTSDTAAVFVRAGNVTTDTCGQHVRR
jgi:hypothetical protein